MTSVLLYPVTDSCKISPAQASEIKMPSNIKEDSNIEGIPGFTPSLADTLLGGQLCPTDDSV
jgi:hypothetical protein